MVNATFVVIVSKLKGHFCYFVHDIYAGTHKLHHLFFFCVKIAFHIVPKARALSLLNFVPSTCSVNSRRSVPGAFVSPEGGSLTSNKSSERNVAGKSHS